MKKLLKEFRDFAFKGNVIDMAVGVMIASAFGKIVTSVVNDLFMPLLSLLTGRIDFSSLGIKLSDAEDGAVFAYGNFLQTLIDFLLIALCIFLFVKVVNKVRAKFEKPAEPAKEPKADKPELPATGDTNSAALAAGIATAGVALIAAAALVRRH